MDYPSWVTLSNLGEFSQDYSFDLYPIKLLFSADPNSLITLLNGNLPQGLSWQINGQSILIYGAASEVVTSTTVTRFTFRIIQPNGTIADRTFTIGIIPLPVVPNWDDQLTFLGYQNNTAVSTYQLSAKVPDGYALTYSLPSPVTGMEIDPLYGILTYRANSIVTNTSVSFNVRAITNAVYNDINLNIDVIISPLYPRWLTTLGSIGTYVGDSFLEYNFLAEDISGAAVSYSLISSSIGFPFVLTPTGLLYGLIPNVIDSITYDFTIRATSVNGYSDRNFSITITLFAETSLLQWITGKNLGSITEGRLINIPILAETTRGTPIYYNVTGGMLPPHLMIEGNTGNLVGFCEYHALPKTYMFDITANDGYQQIIRQFTLIVEKQYVDEFMGAYIPVTGNLRERLVEDVESIEVREPGTATYYNIEDVVTHPVMEIINGIIPGYDSPDQIVKDILPWMHQLNLQIGTASNSAITTSNSTNLSVIYRNIVDSQSNSNLTVAVSNVSITNTVWPISINNLRRSLSNNRSFISSAGGSSFTAYPILDWNTGGILNLIVTNPGSGYKGRPAIEISGSGTGASAVAILGLVSVSIADIGYGWNIGDEIVLSSAGSITPAKLKVSNIGANGSLVSLDIIDAGNYLQTSSASDLVVQRGTASGKIIPVWGVVSTEILSTGSGYQCDIAINAIGTELIPFYQLEYSPVIEQGKIALVVGNHAADSLNNESNTYWGVIWKPNYIVLQWQGLRWLGETALDNETTTFDGNTTRFEETEDARETVFDENLAIFEQGNTIFDYNDPLAYDLFQVWGGTLIDFGTTVVDLYNTLFDVMTPSSMSKTTVRKWIHMQNRIYSGNNAVW